MPADIEEITEDTLDDIAQALGMSPQHLHSLTERNEDI